MYISLQKFNFKIQFQENTQMDKSMFNRQHLKKMLSETTNDLTITQC
jgi:hypothetical protein